jgi:hypothetical protein
MFIVDVRIGGINMGFMKMFSDKEDKKVMDCNPDYVIYNFKEIFDIFEN